MIRRMSSSIPLGARARWICRRAVDSGPIVDDTGAVVGRTLTLQATIETATASITAEVLDGRDTTFVILMNEVD